MTGCKHFRYRAFAVSVGGLSRVCLPAMPYRHSVSTLTIVTSTLRCGSPAQSRRDVWHCMKFPSEVCIFCHNNRRDNYYSAMVNVPGWAAINYKRKHASTHIWKYKCSAGRPRAMFTSHISASCTTALRDSMFLLRTYTASKIRKNESRIQLFS